VRIVADRPDRVRRLMQEQNLDEEKAGALIDQRDESAQKFLSDFFDADWNDPHLYHLVINTSRVPLDQAVQMILRLSEACKTA
ncbi:MAG TPA: cytidylate kinase family protein, partial [Candidatus Ozemobacteraceae bacterium]|nr:cytidylate kinase family protein [Candidatus Ozemobacteraceae bacterium]